MRYLYRICLLALLLFSTTANAAIEAYEFKDAQMEANYNQLINELRCLVCQNQNLSGSDADLARDLRRQTHDMLMKGNSPDQVVDYMVERYGEFVLYRPQFNRGTLLLWLGPFILVAIVLLLVIRNIRSKRALVEPDDASLQRARSLLSDKRDNS